MTPTEIAGLTLSAASLAIQLGEIGEKLTRVFRNSPSTSANSGDLAELSLAIPHELEQTKLLNGVLFEKGKFGLTLCMFEEMDPRNQSIIFGMFNQLSAIWMETHEFVEASLKPGVSTELASQATPRQLEDGMTKRLPAVEKFATPPEIERLKRLLNTAAAWNGRLERSVKNFSWLRSLDGASPARSVARLSRIIEDVHAQKLGWIEPAQLRQLVLAIVNPEIDRASLPMPQSLSLDDNPISGVDHLSDGLVSGMIGRDKVLVEFLPYVKSRIASTEVAMVKRVEQLVALLHLSKHPSFRIPRARGFFHDTRHARFGIVFDIRDLTTSHQTKVLTLQRILQESKPKLSSEEQILRRPSLGNRFRLAHALALSLSNFQSISWVHQGIRSENIAFTVPPLTPGQVLYDKPWLFGYGTSRPDSTPSVTLFDDNPIRNLYRHPDRWGALPAARFNKLHDIYALGVIFLEIAVWSPVSDIVQPKHKIQGSPPTLVQQELISLARHSKVAELMGDQFGRIIEMCLKGDSMAFGVVTKEDDKEDSTLQGAFREKVIELLANALKVLV